MMKRINGLVMGLGLLAAGTIGGVAFAATRGSTSVTPLSSRASTYLRSVSRMVGEPSPSPNVSGQVMAPSHLVSESISGGIMNQAHAAMEYVGFGGGKMMGSSSASPSVSGRVTAKSSLASRISGRIMGTARLAMGYTGFSGGGMMGR
ncbi:MAG: hypothetical protein C7B46_17980 [Sulfobacillus benefaciens]|uniref:Uncharacterized protein n=1 Tax=Sulfobacillus benefaciens TaxID=453960 RepID=A0A2T2X7A8_9FIRM|nr:MAG: hypothetical protein C7B46_17980 [Sulfobacillus benefaciens]